MSVFSADIGEGKRKIKPDKECAECGKRTKNHKEISVCPYHRFSQTILNSNHNNLRQIFIEICYDREINTFNIVQYVAKMLKAKDGIHKKPKQFIEDVCRFAMMGVRGKKLGNSYLSPKTISLYLRYARLPFHLYKQHLRKEHFSLCMNQGYDFEESLQACYGKDASKAFRIVIDELLKRRDRYILILANTQIPPNLYPSILSYLT